MISGTLWFTYYYFIRLSRNFIVIFIIFSRNYIIKKKRNFQKHKTGFRDLQMRGIFCLQLSEGFGIISQNSNLKKFLVHQ